MDKTTADRILQETELGYDMISQKFSQTRKHFWRGLESLNDYTRENDNVLDFGCGNGRLLELFEGKNIQYWGVDVSQKLIEYAQEKYGSEKRHFAKINPSQTSLSSTNLENVSNIKDSGNNALTQAKTSGAKGLVLDEALEEGFFNTIYSIAVFHHFPSQEYREQVAKELFAKTKNGGYVVITVWYLWPSFVSLRRGKQKKYLKNILQNWKNKLLGKSSLDWHDCEISFTDNQGKKFQRFHHAFTKRELKNLFKEAGFKIERCEVVDGRNILLIGRKN